MHYATAVTEFNSLSPTLVNLYLFSAQNMANSDYLVKILS